MSLRGLHIAFWFVMASVSGAAQTFSLGELPAGKTVKVFVKTNLTQSWPANRDSVYSQAIVGAQGIDTGLTNDPDAPARHEPTATAVVADARIALHHQGVDLGHPAAFSFDSMPIGEDSTAVVHIVNVGFSTLQIQLPLQLTGRFSVVQQPDSIIAAGDSAALTLRHLAACPVGERRDTLNIVSNAANISPFTLEVRGVSTDTAAPVATCPGNQTLYADAQCDAALPDFSGQVLATDSCDPAVAVVQSPSAGMLLAAGMMHLVTMTVSDGFGNIAQCQVNVSVEDTTRPVIACPADQTVAADQHCQAAIPDFRGSAAISDNCDSQVIVDQQPVPGTIMQGAGISRVIRLIARDSSGNVGTCMFNLTVVDASPPVIPVMANQFEPLDPQCDLVLKDYTSLPTISDNCDASPFISQMPLPGTTISHPDSVQVYVIAQDATGNADSTSFWVFPVDTTPPTLACPGSQSLAADAQCQAGLPDLLPMATAADACGAFSLQQSPVVGTILPMGAHTVTISATDVSGNLTSCPVVVTVEDLMPPALTAPATQHLAAGPSCQIALPDFTSQAVATDNCSAPTLIQSPASGTVVATGVHTITLTATDAAGNQSQTSFDVHVADSSAPSISCLPGTSLHAQSNCTAVCPDYRSQLQMTDNCDVQPVVVQTPAPGTVLNIGSHSIQFTATDATGNSATCQMMLTVLDTMAPAVSCPSNLSLYTDAQCEALLPDLTSQLVVTDCDPFPVATQWPLAGSTVTMATTSIQLTATDQAGNSGSCSVPLQFVDTVAPTFASIGAQSLTLDTACSAVLPDYAAQVSVIEHCGLAHIVQSPAAGTMVHTAGTVVGVQLTATDVAGNVAQLNFDVELQDALAPEVQCPAAMHLTADAQCEAQLPDLRAQALAWDGCDSNPGLNQHPLAGTTIYPGTTVVTITATDSTGHIAQCTSEVVVADTNAPLLQLPSVLRRSISSSCTYVLQDFTGLVTATDACGVVSLQQTPAAGTPLARGIYDITMSATDASGNAASEKLVLEVVDSLPPVIVHPGPQVFGVDSLCQAIMPDLTSGMTVLDACDTAWSWTQSPPPGSYLSQGTLQATITVQDAAGNQDAIVVSIQVADISDPAVAAPDTLVVASTANCAFTLPDYRGQVVVHDACDANPTLTQSPAPGSVLSSGSHGLSFTATDANGNQGTATTVLLVRDLQAPIITCPGQQQLAFDQLCGLVVPDFTGLATVLDDCDPNPGITQVPLPGSVLSSTSSFVVVLTAVDASGHSSQCQFQVLVSDTSAPQIQCPSTWVAVVDAQCDALVPDLLSSVVVMDACDPNPTLFQQPQAGALLSGQNMVVAITASDSSGNQASCTTAVAVSDTLEPMLIVPDSVQVQIDSQCMFMVPDVLAQSTTWDACDASPVLTQSPVAGSWSSATATAAIMVTAVDSSGNIRSLSVPVVSDDTIKPLLSAPDTIHAFADSTCYQVWPDLRSAVVTSDYCGSQPTVVQSPAPGSLFTSGQVLMFTATDASGNMTTAVSQWVLHDTTAPTLSLSVNPNLVVDAACQASLPDYRSLAVVGEFCPGTVTLQQTPAPGTLVAAGQGVLSIDLTATDASGNSTTQTFQVHILDTLPPVLTAMPDLSVAADTHCAYQIPDYTAQANGIDGCGGPLQWQQHPLPGTMISGLGISHTVVLTAQDSFGNAASTSFLITLFDVHAPTLTCPADIAVSVDSGSCSATVFWPLPVGLDACGSVSLSSSLNPGDVFPQGRTSVMYTATDASGLQSVCSFDVTVHNDRPPYLYRMPKDMDVCDPVVSWKVPEVFTHCAKATLWSSHQPGQAFPLGTTVVTYIATDSFGQSDTASFDIRVHAPPVALAGMDTTICETDTAILGGGMAVPGFTYTWKPSIGVMAPAHARTQASPPVPMQYTLVVTDSFGCSDSADVAIQLKPSPKVYAGQDQGICPGEQVQIGSPVLATGGQPPYQIHWTHGLTLSDSTIALPFASPLQTNVYRAHVTDATGCTGRDDVRVIVHPLPLADIIAPNSICNQLPLQLYGGKTGGTWSGKGVDAQSGMFYPALAGMGITQVSYKVSNVFGCWNSDTASIDVRLPGNVTIGKQQPLCFIGSQVMLVASDPGGKWSGSGITDSLAGVFDPAIGGLGSHFVSYTLYDSTGCIASDTAIITVHPNPDATIHAPASLCVHASPSMLSAATSGGQWQGAGITDSLAGLFDPQFAGVGTTTVIYEVAGPHGCASSDTTSIAVMPAPQVVAQDPGPFCRDAGIQYLQSNAPQATWSGPGIEGTNGRYNPLNAPLGLSQVTVTDTAANGCFASDTLELTIWPSADATFTVPAQLCHDAPVAYLAAAHPNGVWSGAGVHPVSGQFEALQAGVGVHTISYAVTNSYGCSDQQTRLLEVLPPIQTSASRTAAVTCFGGRDGAIDLQVSGGQPIYQYIWSTGATTQDLKGLVAGQYAVSISDAKGCTAADTFVVAANDLIDTANVSILPATSPQHQDGAISLHVVGGVEPYRFVWSDSMRFLNRPKMRPDTFELTVTDAKQCRKTFDFVVPALHTLSTVKLASLDWTIAPNPATDQLVVTPSVALSEVAIALYTLGGQRLLSQTVTLRAGHSIAIPVHDLAAATYILSLRTDGQQWAIPIQVQR